MKFSRRDLFKSAAVAAGGVAAGTAFGGLAARSQSATQNTGQSLPPAFDALKPLGDRVKPIRADALQARVALAQQRMTDANPRFEALYVTPGTTLVYYTGIHWWPSERILALLVPRQGDPLLVAPAFEEGRLREQMRWPVEIRVWQEDESPYPIIEKWLAERGIRTGQVGVEATTRYVFSDGLRHAATSLDYASGDLITVGCRAQKSAHELELMRLACSATCAVYKAVFASLREGMTQHEVSALASRGYARMGLQGEASVFFGASSALPHGSREEQVLREGVGVMIDDGTTVEGYQSDVTRMGVLGKPPEKLQHAFEIVRNAQNAALAAAVAGHECGSVDDAARKVISDAGFGPGYKYFSHRLGHGIGMDGHESPYLVRGNRTILKPGMTFSNEPGIYVVGDYGVRCEDDMVIAESGEAQLLTAGFQPSLETPVP
ncbi:MAG TPA: Xaa-Pro peptidase family protein [Candidatus Acidoferrales bacterium]|jgi:Xaa-Pro dipeptidase|nr:Xaa-Pro peptidase family protein [Candidatus Acidoferrales bacterium]